MQYNVAQLLKEPIGAMRRHSLNESLDGLDEELKALGPLIGAVQMLRTNSGILVTGKLSTVVQATCNRCIEPIAVPVRFEIEESFRPLTEVHTGRYLRPDEFEGSEADLEDAALLINEQHILDLSEVVRQSIWLALPMYPSCNWEGTGECPNLKMRMAELEKLEDVEFYTEATAMHGQDEKEIDPRWAVLLNLRREENAE
ncbi:MAG: YceD family protein [Caldilinea sp.]